MSEEPVEQKDTSVLERPKITHTVRSEQTGLKRTKRIITAEDADMFEPGLTIEQRRAVLRSINNRKRVASKGGMRGRWTRGKKKKDPVLSAEAAAERINKRIRQHHKIRIGQSITHPAPNSGGMEPAVVPGDRSKYLQQLAKYGLPIQKGKDGLPLITADQLKIIGDRWKSVVNEETFFNTLRHHLSGLTQPEAYLALQIAYLRTKIDMQETLDAKRLEKAGGANSPIPSKFNNSTNVFSKDYLEATRLFKEFLELQERREERKAKVNMPTIQAGIVNFNAPPSETQEVPGKVTWDTPSLEVTPPEKKEEKEKSIGEMELE